MFTGIVEERGEVLVVAGGRLVVGCLTVRSDSGIGASVAVSGACLTVIERTDVALAFELTRETLDRTNLGDLEEGNPVNLERPATLASRLGGHLVQGHVDAVGEVASVDLDGDEGAMLVVRLPASCRRYVVEKGSVAVEGVSLTVASIDDDLVGFALIPHTVTATTLGTVRARDPVNIEVDPIAKYVERLMEGART